jgi:hypothetical protein
MTRRDKTFYRQTKKVVAVFRRAGKAAKRKRARLKKKAA